MELLPGIIYSVKLLLLKTWIKNLIKEQTQMCYNDASYHGGKCIMAHRLLLQSKSGGFWLLHWSYHEQCTEIDEGYSC